MRSESLPSGSPVSVSKMKNRAGYFRLYFFM